MLDAYVIEEIKRREREKTRDDRPSVELPIPLGPTHAPEDPPRDRGEGGGVVIIDYS